MKKIFVRTVRSGHHILIFFNLEKPFTCEKNSAILEASLDQVSSSMDGSTWDSRGLERSEISVQINSKRSCVKAKKPDVNTTTPISLQRRSQNPQRSDSRNRS